MEELNGLEEDLKTYITMYAERPLNEKNVHSCKSRLSNLLSELRLTVSLVEHKCFDKPEVLKYVYDLKAEYIKIISGIAAVHNFLMELKLHNTVQESSKIKEGLIKQVLINEELIKELLND